MKLRITILSLLSLLSAPLLSSDTIPVGDIFYLWQGFEQQNNWTTEDWENNSLHDPQITSDFVSQGTRSLEIKLDARKPGQTAMIQNFDTGDMSGVREIAFDIFNSSLTDMQLFLMLKTGDNWLYHESKRVTVKPGWNRHIRFDLTRNIYGTNGQYTGTVKFLQNVRRLGIGLIPGKATDGFIYVDNILIKGPDAAKFLPSAKPDGTREVLLDGFEPPRIRWVAASDWSAATKVERVELDTTEGSAAMKCHYLLNSPGKNAVYSIEGSADLTSSYDVKFDVYYPYDFPANIGLALGTGDKWEWQEGPAVKIKKGWNRDITINLQEKKWKNEGSKWTSTVMPAGLDQVKRFSILLFPSEMGEGYVLVDNVRIETTDKSRLSSILPSDLGDLAYYPWNSFEKGVNFSAVTDEYAQSAVSPADGFGGSAKRGMKFSFSTTSELEKAVINYMGHLNWSNAAAVKFDAYNPMDTAVKMSLAFKIGDDETWYESKQVPLAPGWNREIIFDFVNPSFKSAASNWNYTDTLFDRDDIREVIISVFPEKKMDGAVYFSDIMLCRKNYLGDAGRYFGATFVNNSGATVERITYQVWDSGAGEGTFEKGAGNWSPYTESGWGAVALEPSGLYASEGASSLQVRYKDTGVKSGIKFVPQGTLNLSGRDYMAFDVYNPGRRGKVSVAFKYGAEGWDEYKEITLYPGWNRNIKVNLSDSFWKNKGTGFRNVTTLSGRDSINTVIILFTGLQEGTLYLDNIRWGTSASGMELTEAHVQQDVNIEFAPTDYFNGSVTMRGTYYHGQNKELNIESAHLSLRGMGNELELFGGESINLFDDTFAIVDSGSLGPNLMGARLLGTVFPLGISYRFAGATLLDTRQWALGTTYLGGVSGRKYFMGSNYLGGLYFTNRRGYDSGGSFISGELEQAVHTYGADTKLSIPLTESISLGLRSEVLFSSYDTKTPIYLVNSVPAGYVYEQIPEDAPSKLQYVSGDLHIGEATFNGSYRKIDPYFPGTYMNTDYKLGTESIIGKLIYIVDNLPPFSGLKIISPEWQAFVRYTKLTLEYDTMSSFSDTYERKTYRVLLENDKSLALYNYELYYKYNFEGNGENTATGQTDTRTPSHTFNGVTKISFGNFASLKLLGRLEMMKETVFNTAKQLYEDIDSNRATAFAELSVKPLKDLKLTMNYKFLGSASQHSNFYAELEAVLFSALEAVLSFGEEPFSGYWLDNSSNDTSQIIKLSLRGTF